VGTTDGTTDGRREAYGGGVNREAYGGGVHKRGRGLRIQAVGTRIQAANTGVESKSTPRMARKKTQQQASPKYAQVTRPPYL
jgi:hypothetical protein